MTTLAWLLLTAWAGVSLAFFANAFRPRSWQSALGTYADFDEACAVRLAAERRYGFHANHDRPWRATR